MPNSGPVGCSAAGGRGKQVIVVVGVVVVVVVVVAALLLLLLLWFVSSGPTQTSLFERPTVNTAALTFCVDYTRRERTPIL